MNPPSEPRQFWWAQGSVAGIPDVRWLDWKLLLDDRELLQDGVGKPCFVAGITGTPGLIAALPPGAETQFRDDDLRAIGVGDSTSGNEYVVGVRYLDALPDASLEQQATYLARWVSGALSAAEQAFLRS